MPNSLSIMAGEDNRKVDISPLFIGLLGIIAGAIIVATYHCISISCCTQRHTTTNSTNQPPPRQQIPQHNEELIEEETTTSGSSTSSSSTVQLIIPVYKYGKGCKEDVCAVCLSEYKNGEEIRILPECAHSFHAACIDMWLYSHSNCPLCRADATPLPPLPQPLPHVVVALPPEQHGGVQNLEG